MLSWENMGVRMELTNHQIFESKFRVMVVPRLRIKMGGQTPYLRFYNTSMI
jgi:hypothetical protein